jgi:hypothetical protein
MPLAAGEAQGGIIAHDTCTQTMGQRLAWVGFTLPGMIEEPGSFSGSDQLPKAGARAGAQEAGCRWRS